MTALKRTSKVTPIPTPQKNNFFVKGYGTIRQSRFIIITQTVLGINRLNLLNCCGFVKWLGFIYNFFLVGLTISILVISNNDEYNRSHGVSKKIVCIEYCLLILSSILLMRKKLQSFYYDIGQFDAVLSIDENLSMTSPIWSSIAWITTSVVYFICEYATLSICVPQFKSAIFTPIWYLTALAHDSEQIFFVMLMRFVLMRLQVLKGHITKAFSIEDKESNHGKTGKLENLANNTELDTSAMHRAYELLHKCAEELNAAVSFPMFVTLFTSGLITTLYLKLIFQAGQFPDYAQVMVIYSAIRCCKYTILVVAPCYYSSITAQQVSIIRTILHNAINTSKMDKIERRKIKAFFLLAQDNDFTYALWGVIRFNMALPLSYTSLCTTYLVIIIQFSKFID